MANKIIVGTDQCSIENIVSIMKSDKFLSLVSKKWKQIAMDLGIPDHQKEDWKLDKNLGKTSLEEIIFDMVQTWVAGKGSEASLDDLQDAVTKNGLKNLSDLLGKKFVSSTKQCENYCRIPQGLQDFFSKTTDLNLAIIATLSSYITCEKIKDSDEICLFLSVDKFLKELSTDNDYSIGQIYVVIVKNLDIIEKLLEAIKSSTPVPKLLIISEDKEEVIEKKIKGNLSIHNDEMKWDDLTAKFKLEKKRKFEGEFGVKYEKLSGSVCGQLLVDLISDEEIHLFESIPRELLVNYYIPRMIIKRNYLDSEKLFQKGSSKDVFAFTGINKTELDAFAKCEMTVHSTSLVQKQRLTDYRFIVLNDPSDFLIICGITEEAVHLIDFKDEQFQWKKSSKRIQTIQKMISEKPKASALTEKEFIEEIISGKEERRVVCISDRPGMGKSVLLAKIGNRLQDRITSCNLKRIIIFIPAPNLTNLMKQKLDKNTFELALHSLCCQNQEILSEKLSSLDLQIELLLDGFDEIERERQPFSIKLIQFLLNEFNSIRIWLTTRPHHLQELGEKLNTIGFNIQPFTEQDQINFLTSFWTSGNPELKKDSVLAFSSEFLETFRSNTQSFRNGLSGQAEIAGIPLQCLLIAEVYEEYAVRRCSPSRVLDGEVPIEINSIVTLYERLVKKKFEKYEKIYSCSSNTISSLYDIHSRFALELIFPQGLNETWANLFDKSVKIEEMYDVGLLQVSNKNSTNFIHRTFAEYFCANFVFEKILKNHTSSEAVINFVFNTFFSRIESIWEYYVGYNDYEFNNFVACYFLDCLLDEVHTSLVSVALPTGKNDISFKDMKEFIMSCAHGKFQNLLKLFEKHPSFAKHAEDLFEEKFILQSIEQYDLEMLKIFIDYYEKYSKCTPRFKLEALLKAFYIGDKPKFKYLLNVRWSNRKMDIGYLFQKCLVAGHDNDGSEYYFRTLYSNRVDILKLLVDMDGEILQKSYYDPSISPLLQRMSCNFSLELVKLGANISSKDKNGSTLLHLHAWSEDDFLRYFETIPLSTLKQLIKKKNSQGLTPIALAFTQNVQFSKECMEKWKELGTDFNESFNGLPLFLLAIQSGNGGGALRYMVEKGHFSRDNLSWTQLDSGQKFFGQFAFRQRKFRQLKEHPQLIENEDKKTLMDFAAEAGNADAVSLLVEHEMDVNGLNTNSKSPLDYLILGWKTKKEKPEKYFQTGRTIWELGGKYKFTTPEILQEFASEIRDLQALEFSLQTGLEANHKNKDGNTLLHMLACKWNNTEAIKIALKHGSDPSITNNDGLTPLELSVKSSPIQVTVEYLPLLKPSDDFKWSDVSRSVTSENFSTFLATFANNLEREDEFLSLFNEVMKRDSNEKSSCLFSLFKKRNRISPAQFHSIIMHLKLRDGLVKLFTDPDENCLVPFHHALQNIQGIKMESMNLLRKAPEIDLKIKDGWGRSLLFYAVDGGQTPDFLEMLSTQAGELEEIDNDCKSLLHEVVTSEKGSPEMITFLVKKGLNPNVVDNAGNTPLHCLMYLDLDSMQSSEKKILMAEVLLELGANPEIKSRKGYTPFDVALGTGHHSWPLENSRNRLGYFQLIWKYKSSNQGCSLISLKLNRSFINDFLINHAMKLAEEQFLYLVEAYLKSAEIPDDEKRKGQLWLDFVWYQLCREDWKPIDSSRFHLLAEYVTRNHHGKGDIFADEDEKGARPMHYVVEYMRVEERTLELLRSKGIDLRVRDKNGWSLLFHAVKGTKATPRYLELLKKYVGGDLKEKDKSGQNLLRVAVQHNFGRNLDLMEFLLDKDKVGLDPNEWDENRDTPLHILIKVYGHDRDTFAKKAKVLIEAGASIYLENLKGETVLGLAGQIKDWSDCKMWLLNIYSSVI